MIHFHHTLSIMFFFFFIVSPLFFEFDFCLTFFFFFLYIPVFFHKSSPVIMLNKGVGGGREGVADVRLSKSQTQRTEEKL